MSFSCPICLSPYLKATVNRLLNIEGLSVGQVAQIAQTDVFSVMIHERELFVAFIDRMGKYAERLEAAQAQPSCDLALVVDGLPASGVYRIDLPDGKTVRLTIGIEEDVTQ